MGHIDRDDPTRRRIVASGATLRQTEPNSSNPYANYMAQITYAQALKGDIQNKQHNQQPNPLNSSTRPFNTNSGGTRGPNTIIGSANGGRGGPNTDVGTTNGRRAGPYTNNANGGRRGPNTDVGTANGGRGGPYTNNANGGSRGPNTDVGTANGGRGGPNTNIGIANGGRGGPHTNIGTTNGGSRTDIGTANGGSRGPNTYIGSADGGSIGPNTHIGSTGGGSRGSNTHIGTATGATATYMGNGNGGTVSDDTPLSSSSLLPLQFGSFDSLPNTSHQTFTSTGNFSSPPQTISPSSSAETSISSSDIPKLQRLIKLAIVAGRLRSKCKTCGNSVQHCCEQAIFEAISSLPQPFIHSVLHDVLP